MKFTLLLLFCFISIQVFSKKVSEEKAKKIAENWSVMKMSKSKGDIDIDKKIHFISNNDTSLYVFNFKNGGFVIVPTDDNTYPVMAYSNDNQIDLDHIELILRDWLYYYADMIKFNKKEPKEKNIKNNWEKIEACISLKSTQTTVPSLFESTQSSRWAYWRPYFNQAPQAQSQYYEGYNSCVPGSIARIMKYYKYPLIGTGIGSGYNNGSYFTQNINSFFNYDQMPFRLTYCGNGQNNCNDGSFNLIPGVTQAQIDEVGKLQYNAGLAAGMEWLGIGDTAKAIAPPTGITGSTTNWISAMANHFYYATPTSSDYWSSSKITADPTGFKSGLRSSLNNGYPILFRYDTSANGGHAVVIDGYENDNYFHFSMGFGGYMDAYYYLFSSDNDGVHLPRPSIIWAGLDACMNIRPNCPSSQDVTVTNKTVSNGTGELIQSGNDLLIDHVTIQAGGRAVLRADHAIIISNDFEVALGGEVLMLCKPCTN